jgi:hypothetical protein
MLFCLALTFAPIDFSELATKQIKTTVDAVVHLVLHLSGRGGRARKFSRGPSRAEQSGVTALVLLRHKCNRVAGGRGVD